MLFRSEKEGAALAQKLFKFLAPREEKILRMRYGFDRSEPGEHSVQEIADAFERSTGRIRQIEAQALRKLCLRMERINAAEDPDMQEAAVKEVLVRLETAAGQAALARAVERDRQRSRDVQAAARPIVKFDYDKVSVEGPGDKSSGGNG